MTNNAFINSNNPSWRKLRKALLSVTAIIVLVISPVNADTGPDGTPTRSEGPLVDGLRLVLTLDTTTFEAGHPVECTLTFQNHNDHPINLPQMTELETFEIAVQTPTGEPAVLTQYGQRQSNPIAGRMILIEVKPKSENKSVILLNRLFDLSRNGKYEVQFKRRVPGQKSIESGKLSFRVDQTMRVPTTQPTTKPS